MCDILGVHLIYHMLHKQQEPYEIYQKNPPHSYILDDSIQSESLQIPNLHPLWLPQLVQPGLPIFNKADYFSV